MGIGTSLKDADMKVGQTSETSSLSKRANIKQRSSCGMLRDQEDRYFNSTQTF